MTDTKNPFEAMMAMSQEWAKALNPALESFTPKGFEALWPTMPKEVMETVMGKTFNPEGLDAKTNMLLTLGALTILGAQAEAQIRLTVRHALAGSWMKSRGSMHPSGSDFLAISGIRLNGGEGWESRKGGNHSFEIVGAKFSASGLLRDVAAISPM